MGKDGRSTVHNPIPPKVRPHSAWVLRQKRTHCKPVWTCACHAHRTLFCINRPKKLAMRAWRHIQPTVATFATLQCIQLSDFFRQVFWHKKPERGERYIPTAKQFESKYNEGPWQEYRQAWPQP